MLFLLALSVNAGQYLHCTSYVNLRDGARMSREPN